MIDDVIAARWKQAFEALWQTLNASPEHDVGPGRRNYRKLHRDKGFESALKSFREAGVDDWNAAREILLRGPLPAGSPFGVTKPAHTVRMLHLGLLMAGGETSELTEEEYAFVAAAAPHTPWFKLPPANVRVDRDVRLEPDKTILIDVAFPWFQASRPGQPQGPRKATARVPLQGIDPETAPVVMTLAAPGGGALEIRKRDSEWLRPLLEPGSWRPCKTGRMIEALASGEAWRDSPLNPTRSHESRTAVRAETLMSIDEYAAPEPKPLPSDLQTIAKTESMVADACSGLYDIGGFAYIRTPIPSLEVHLFSGHYSSPETYSNHAAAPAWRAGLLTSSEDQATICKDWTPRWAAHGIGSEAFTFGIGAEDVLHDALRRWRRSPFVTEDVEWVALLNARFKRPLAESVDGHPLPREPWRLAAFVLSAARDLAKNVEADSVRARGRIFRDGAPAFGAEELEVENADRKVAQAVTTAAEACVRAAREGDMHKAAHFATEADDACLGHRHSYHLANCRIIDILEAYANAEPSARFEDDEEAMNSGFAL